MEIFSSVADAFAKYLDAYLAVQKMGNCMVCKKYEDLRCGACFHCCDKVSGKPIKGGHRLWETANPDNTWYVGNL